MLTYALITLACSAPDTDSGTAGRPRDTSTDATSASAPANDSAPAPDTGLAWTGDLAPYEGCAPGDPAAKFLSQRSPSGPVTAGAAVSGELVVANCESAAWVAALTEDAIPGVKLASTSSTVTDTWSRPRVLLPADVPPSHAVRLRWEATAPLVDGPHPWQWQMVDEWVRWIGTPTPMVNIEITGGYGPFVVHGRSEWEDPAYPVDGPDMELGWLEYVTIHYNGVTEDLDGDDDVYQDADAIDRIRNVQEYSYYSNDGVSAGYNSYIAPDGDEWEIRGHDIRNAASGCPEVNFPGYTIVIPTTSPDAAPTGAQIEGARAAIFRIREAAAAAGNTTWLYINGHGDVAPECGSGTSCPGAPIEALIAAGSLEP